MRKIFFIIFAIVFCPAACNSPKITQVVSPSQLPYESPNPSVTPTIEFAATQIPATAKVTSHLTMPTFTPTFDTKTIVTVTPVSKAVCPKENPTVPNFDVCKNGGCSIPDGKTILNYLNSGGRLDGIKFIGEVADFTGDGVKDLLAYSDGEFSVYGCNDGKYQVIWEFKGTQRTPHLDYIGDLNRDGVPELIIINAERHAFLSIQIFEWNGSEFVSLIKRIVDSYVFDFLGGVAFEYKVSDLNNDGVKEVIGVDNELFTYEGLAGIPLRRFTTILAWNGRNYVVVSDEPSPPTYRFQAIQDADYEVLHGRYEKALNLYHEAIFNDKLEWWSKERHEFEVYTALNSYFEKDSRNYTIFLTMTPTPYPTMATVPPDKTEYPRLAAYAYYRIMLVYFVQGNKAEAETTYETLQQKFADNQYSAPYVEMATSFWNAYQSLQNITIACDAAIEYSIKHPSVLIPLGSDYHGVQSKIYKPEDVCPF